jgi:hypothetical protein
MDSDSNRTLYHHAAIISTTGNGGINHTERKALVFLVCDIEASNKHASPGGKVRQKNLIIGAGGEG